MIKVDTILLVLHDAATLKPSAAQNIVLSGIGPLNSTCYVATYTVTPCKHLICKTLNVFLIFLKNCGYIFVIVYTKGQNCRLNLMQL